MLNKVSLIGNLGGDPERHDFENGGVIANISLATTRRWKDKESGEKKDETEWHRVAFHNKLAEVVCDYLKKGSQVYVEGRIRTRKWQDNDGQDRYSTDIVASEMKMLGRKPDAHSSSPPIEPPPSQHNDFDDEIPF